MSSNRLYLLNFTDLEVIICPRVWVCVGHMTTVHYSFSLYELSLNVVSGLLTWPDTIVEDNDFVKYLIHAHQETSPAFVCECMFVCMRACVRACVRVCVRESIQWKQ